MSDNTINSAVSALKAYSTMLSNTANNVANVNTENYNPLETTMQDSATGGVTAASTRDTNTDRVDLSKEVVDLITAQNGFKANITVLKTGQEIQKSVIDILA